MTLPRLLLIPLLCALAGCTTPQNPPGATLTPLTALKLASGAGQPVDPSRPPPMPGEANVGKQVVKLVVQPPFGRTFAADFDPIARTDLQVGMEVTTDFKTYTLVAVFPYDPRGGTLYWPSTNPAEFFRAGVIGTNIGFVKGVWQ